MGNERSGFSCEGGAVSALADVARRSDGWDSGGGVWLPVHGSWWWRHSLSGVKVACCAQFLSHGSLLSEFEYIF